jgi:hypothetical protein
MNIFITCTVEESTQKPTQEHMLKLDTVIARFSETPFLATKVKVEKGFCIVSTFNIFVQKKTNLLDKIVALL